eukprot:TRINITY_DN872_c1_g1_i5.p1 TRINITY_DN872_c1_g1~~TRINITY_DN872_c1_g1_i5.p1  ORF type:complete len:791 (+),score=211.66 TRINITY_DN872_c1_g1_i5:2-2374(+)
MNVNRNENNGLPTLIDNDDDDSFRFAFVSPMVREAKRVERAHKEETARALDAFRQHDSEVFARSRPPRKKQRRLSLASGGSGSSAHVHHHNHNQQAPLQLQQQHHHHHHPQPPPLINIHSITPEDSHIRSIMGGIHPSPPTNPIGNRRRSSSGSHGAFHFIKKSRGEQFQVVPWNQPDAFVNPFQPDSFVSMLSSNRRRWMDMYPKGEKIFFKQVNFNSIVLPALLPMTTDFLPSSEEINQHFEITATYKLVGCVNDMKFMLVDMIMQRLLNSFQLVRPASKTLPGAFSSAGPLGKTTLPSQFPLNPESNKPTIRSLIQTLPEIEINDLTPLRRRNRKGREKNVSMFQQQQQQLHQPHQQASSDDFMSTPSQPHAPYHTKHSRQTRPNQPNQPNQPETKKMKKKQSKGFFRSLFRKIAGKSEIEANDVSSLSHSPPPTPSQKPPPGSSSNRIKEPYIIAAKRRSRHERNASQQRNQSKSKSSKSKTNTNKESSSREARLRKLRLKQPLISGSLLNNNNLNKNGNTKADAASLKRLLTPNNDDAISRTLNLLQSMVNPTTGAVFNLSMGHQIHRISFQEDDIIDVTALRRRFEEPLKPFQYRYFLLDPFTDGWQYRQSVFRHHREPEINWNYLDNLLTGYHEAIPDTIHARRMRFVILPRRPLGDKDEDENVDVSVCHTQWLDALSNIFKDNESSKTETPKNDDKNKNKTKKSSPHGTKCTDNNGDGDDDDPQDEIWEEAVGIQSSDETNDRKDSFEKFIQHFQKMFPNRSGEVREKKKLKQAQLYKMIIN